MAVSSMTYNFDSLLSTTWMNYREKLYDNIFNANPIFYWMHENSRKRVEDGGERIVIPLEYAMNSTIKSMTSGYDIIDTTPQDTLTSAYYTWKEVAGSTVIANREMAMNSGKNKIIALLESKATNTEMSMSENLNKMLLAFTSGNGGNDLTPIFQYVQKNPAAVSTVGGIAQGSYAWWRNQYLSGAGVTTYAGHLNQMDNLYNTCSKGGSKNKRKYPDAIFCDQKYYELYAAACRSKGQIMLANEPVGNLGFGGLKFRGATLMWDEYFPDVNTTTAVTNPDDYTRTNYGAIFVNSEFLEFVVCKGQDFVVGPFIQPENQKVKVSILYLMGELTCSNRRKQGMHYAVVTTIVA